MRTPRVAAAAAVAWLLLAAQEARAVNWIIEKNETHKKDSFDVMGVVSPYVAGHGGGGLLAIGGGVNYAIPIVQDGFIPDLNDQFDLEGSVYMFYLSAGGGSALALAPLAGVRWQFHLTPDWSVFPILKLGMLIGVTEGGSEIGHDFGVGAYWHLNQDVAVRLELGTLGLFTVGLSMPL